MFQQMGYANLIPDGGTFVEQKTRYQAGCQTLTLGLRWIHGNNKLQHARDFEN